MKYFFLAYAIVAALVIGLLPMRGEKSPETPLRLFPDMDDQDRLDAQAPSEFFADGAGGRHPVDGTRPLGFQADGETELGGIPSYEFGGGTGYYETGGIEGYYSNGMPEELGLTEDNVVTFLRRGREVYNINCMPCHGESGDGLGVTANYGVPGIANLTLESFQQATYPDGRMFDVISNGKNNMGAYKHNIPLRDRWAVVAYVRALQLARKAPLSESSIQEAFEAQMEEQKQAAQ